MVGLTFTTFFRIIAHVRRRIRATDTWTKADIKEVQLAISTSESVTCDVADSFAHRFGEIVFALSYVRLKFNFPE